MSEIMKLVLSLSISASMLMIMLFVLKPFIRNKISKTVQYFLWIIVLIRLVLPFSFETNMMNKLFYSDEDGVVTFVSPGGQTESTKGNNTLDVRQLMKGNIPNSEIAGPISNRIPFTDAGNFVFYIWVFVAAILLLINIASYIRFSKQMKRSNRPATADDDRVLSAVLHRRRDSVRLVRNTFVSTPMLVGIFRPYIVIPDSNFTEKQLKYILMHEITHMRRFDVGVKWLTMIAASIHWFNPFIYMMKREINHACELACDETVIKNLDPTEKQGYGDTLLAVAAKQIYPIGALQATMSEEKRGLKDRLIFIMNYRKKPKLMIVLSGAFMAIVIFGALYLGGGAGIGFSKTGPPNLYISTEDDVTKEAIRGTYSWSDRSGNIEADSDHPLHFDYTLENIVRVTSGQQFFVSTEKLKKDKKYEFSIERIEVYKDGEQVQLSTLEPHFTHDGLYLSAPHETGEYIYLLVLNYDKGTVSYGFKMQVGMMTFNLEEISKYKTPYIGEHSKVSGIAGNLPLPDPFFKQQYIALKTSEKPYGLTIYYEPMTDGNENNWPMDSHGYNIEGHSATNALVVFSMISNLDEVTFAFKQTSSNGELDTLSYDNAFTFSRSSFEERYGDLSELGNNLELLREILLVGVEVR